jgi:hypothetical protein
MTVLRKIRSQQIVIDLPTEEAEVWVRATLQRCIKDEAYGTVQTIDRVGFIHRSFPQFALQMTTITDPVTGQTCTLSGAGAATLIRDMICAWILSDTQGALINEQNDVIEG